MIKLAVFDMAGTTVRDQDNVHHALMSAMAHFGYTVSREEANNVMGYPKPVAIQQLLEARQADVQQVDAIYKRFLLEMNGYYRSSPDVAPTPFAEESFERLRANGIKVALDTGFSRQIVETILDRLDWAKKIDAWVASDMAPRGRPHEDMILYLMEQTGVTDPMQVAKIGDTHADIQEGRSAGVALNIAVTSGAFTREALAQENPTHLAADLQEATDIILGLRITE